MVRSQTCVLCVRLIQTRSQFVNVVLSRRGFKNLRIGREWDISIVGAPMSSWYTRLIQDTHECHLLCVSVFKKKITKARGEHLSALALTPVAFWGFTYVIPLPQDFYSPRVFHLLIFEQPFPAMHIWWQSIFEAPSEYEEIFSRPLTSFQEERFSRISLLQLLSSKSMQIYFMNTFDKKKLSWMVEMRRQIWALCPECLNIWWA